ncbi:MAG: bifunctional 4-hydroxy-2-oxoglutarate aldolase/2-dehydro-3-deoxy-phosphogluconate aldolase [Betaproteobacteria bacterium]|nr:bifunctional 4-hydroxy-2-oxoglutarate aldolase/2-dehydro-3-deoxy-phosphogluconate aldolase [Betaproteobacteria bacterium]
MRIQEIMNASPVMPVLVIEDVARAVPLARALVEGGIRVLEITLRTAVALECVRAILKEVPEAITGVGTITQTSQLQSVIETGAAFGVSPGLSESLLNEVKRRDFPFLPGVMTPTEVMTAYALGFRAMKLFPAQQAGGLGMLKALAGPFADIRFCPTGGVDANSAADFLALPNVGCVGGSWIAPKGLVDKGDWAGITALARQAGALRAK